MAGEKNFRSAGVSNKAAAAPPTKVKLSSPICCEATAGQEDVGLAEPTNESHPLIRPALFDPPTFSSSPTMRFDVAAKNDEACNWQLVATPDAGFTSTNQADTKSSASMEEKSLAYQAVE